MSASSSIVTNDHAPPRQADESPPVTVMARLPGQRDARGRILPSPPVIEDADERLTADEVRARVKALYGQAARGSLGGLARLCGFRSQPRQTLRNIARGTGHLMEANRRRISRVLNQIERGELICTDTGKRRSGYPVYVWEHRARPGAAPGAINARKD